MRLPRTFEAHIMLHDSLSAGFGFSCSVLSCLFFFLFPFGMRLLVAIYWKCLTCFSQGLTAKSLSSVLWEIWKSY